MRDKVIEKLFELQDEKYRKFHSGLCPGLENMIGVRIPAMRKMAKEIAKGDYQKFLTEVKNEYYEETLIEGLVIAEAKMPLAEKLEWIKKFVPKIDNWATCDVVCSTYKFKEKDLAGVWKFILQYQNSEDEFSLRFMLIMMLDYFIRPEYVDRVLQIVNEIKNEAYYVKMAQAWLIAEIFAKQREKCVEFLQNNDLSPWVQNKAIQKIRESYRVTAEDKEMVKGWRK